MKHKRIIIASIMVVAIFSFGRLKPMENYATCKQEPDFENIKTFKRFEDKNHLIKLCRLQKKLICHNMPVIKKAGKFIRQTLNYGPNLLTAGLTLWNLEKAIKNESWDWKTWGVQTFFVSTSMVYEWKIKEPWNNVIKKWDDERLEALYKKQKALKEPLDKINKKTPTSVEYNAATIDDACKSLALFLVLKKQANESNNFIPLEQNNKYGGPFNLRKQYENETNVANWFYTNRADANRYMPGAHQHIQKLMSALEKS